LKTRIQAHRLISLAILISLFSQFPAAAESVKVFQFNPANGSITDTGTTTEAVLRQFDQLLWERELLSVPISNWAFWELELFTDSSKRFSTMVRSKSGLVFSFLNLPISPTAQKLKVPAAFIFVVNDAGRVIIEPKHLFDGKIEKAVELPDGNIALVGYSLGMPNVIHLMGMNTRGEIIWDNPLGEGVLEDLILAPDRRSLYATGFNLDRKPGHFISLALAFDLAGNLLWRKERGPFICQWTKSICQNESGNLFQTGLSLTIDRDYDVVVYKLDSSGDKIWLKSFGGKFRDVGKFVFAAPEDGCVVFAETNSPDCNVEEIHGSGSNFDSNNLAPVIWMLRLDRSGQLLWQKGLGIKGRDEAISIFPTTDGNYLLAGFSAEEMVEKGFLHLIASSGNTVWEKRISPEGRSNVLGAIQDEKSNVYFLRCQVPEFGKSDGSIHVYLAKYSPPR
jgi:hypothetical protein